MDRLLTVLFVFLLVGCHSYKKEIPTGRNMKMTNSVAHPTYDHGKIMNLLVLPIDNTYKDESVALHHQDLTMSAIRNLSKFNYFNVQYDPHFSAVAANDIVNLATGFIDPVRIGAVGEEYNAQGVMQISIDEFQAFAPMRLKLKAVIIDTETGERVWAFDQTFDADDASVINAMRIWWNTRIAGGDPRNHFDITMVRPSIFSNFAFFSMARSYAEARVRNVDYADRMAKERIEQERELQEMRAGSKPQSSNPAFH